MSITLLAELPDIAATGRDIQKAFPRILTGLAYDGRDDVRDELPRVFILKNRYTERGVMAFAAKPSDLEAAVVAPDYLEPNITGEDRTPRNSRYLAGPDGKAFPRDRAISRSNWAGALKGRPGTFIMEMKSGKVAIAQRRGKKRKPLRILYWLTESQSYDPIFDFVGAVEAAVAHNLGKQVDKAFAEGVVAPEKRRVIRIRS